MFHHLKELYTLLTREQRRKLMALQVLVVIMSFTEIAGVVSIGPFMALVGDIEQLQGDGLLAELYRFSGLATPEDFLFMMGLAVLLLLVVAGLFSMYTTWRLSLYGAYVGAELSSRLYRYYMHQPWLFHSAGSSSYLTKQIAQECQRITAGIINPVMQMNAKLVMALLMSTVVFVYNPVVAVSALIIFSASYFVLYKTVRMKLTNNGRTISEAQNHRYQLMAEGFGGIKDVLLLGRQSLYVTQFDRKSNDLAQSMGGTQALRQVPRYAMEIIAFGGVIFLILYLLKSHQGNLGTILPVLSVYALAGFKLLPAFQQTYSSVSSIRGTLSAYEAIRDDLWASREISDHDDGMVVAPSHEHSPDSATPFRRDVVLSQVDFHYPGKSEAALKGLSLTIPINRVIGLVGASGSGKSTIIDLLLGLIEPDAGQVFIDGRPLTRENRRAWQDTIGFVSQSIFLADASIRRNIAFGLPDGDIDEARVERAVDLSHLRELVDELDEGLDTRVGERGIQLSGGQRQRIGIARALYHDASVLILDEATSALDGITEKIIMDAIHDFSGSKTIVLVAHRLATVKQCDCIYLISCGRVVDQGNYDSLIQDNEMFRRMAQHA
ncbi:ABC transporter ATP-binding protein [Aidingimonas halophila]|uniref:HlyD family secretion protein n=1 Tax=Aidingimonas halophila TaxID=574349 RepID=A0A1H3CI34_9GAMM|nr:ABC transporter ATP-binding protein [Aidingimonas halophila]GHC35432.1 ABC transporter ATP-binding protein [Aidingimonas halophila]SDX53793.1 HlyD family secretion protein [Aidingimonas halophila]